MKAEYEKSFDKYTGFPFDIFTIPTDQFYTCTKTTKQSINRLSPYPTEPSTSDESDDGNKSTDSVNQDNIHQYENQNKNKSMSITSFLNLNWRDAIKITALKVVFLCKHQLLCCNKGL